MTLGPGVRVWIGWAPVVCRVLVNGDPRCQCGVVVEGPFPPRMRVLFEGRPYLLPTRSWRVQVADRTWLVVEPMLFPIDGGDAAQPRETIAEIVHRKGLAVLDKIERELAR